MVYGADGDKDPFFYRVSHQGWLRVATGMELVKLRRHLTDAEVPQATDYIFEDGKVVGSLVRSVDAEEAEAWGA